MRKILIPFVIISIFLLTPFLHRVDAAEPNKHRSTSNVATESDSKASKEAGDKKHKGMSEGDRVAAEGYYDFIMSDMAAFAQKPDDAMREINAAIKAHPDSAYLYYQRAVFNAALMRYDDSINDCQTALAKDPKLLDASLLLGKLYSSKGKHEEAVAQFLAASRSDPKKEDTYTFLAREYITLKKYPQAIAVMRELLKIDSTSIVGYYYLGLINGVYLKQYNVAHQMFAKILDFDPDNIQVRAADAQLYLEQKQQPKALKQLEEIEKRVPDDLGMQLRMAIIYYDMGDLKSAIMRLEKIVSKHPNSDKLRYYLAALYEEDRSLDRAIENYQMIPPKSSFYKDAILRLAFISGKLDQLDKAIAILNDAISKKPKTIEFYELLATIYEKKGDIKSTARIIAKAAGLDKKSEKIWFALAVVYEKMKERDKAVRAMREVIKLNPKNVSALNYVGYTYAERGKNLKEAEDLLQEAVSLKPDDGFIIDSLGWLYFMKGDLTRAEELITRALQLVGGEPTVLKHYGALLLKKGDKQGAADYLTRALAESEKRGNIDADELKEIKKLLEETK